jgi:hypothetical protein
VAEVDVAPSTVVLGCPLGGASEVGGALAATPKEGHASSGMVLLACNKC